MALGQFVDIVTGLGGVHLPGQQGLAVFGQIFFEQLGLAGRHQQLTARLVGVDRAVKRRVEGFEFVQRHAGQLGGDVDVHMLAGAHRHEIRAIVEFVQFEAKALGFGQNIAHGQQLGHVVAGFVGHADGFKRLRQALGAIALQCAADIAFAPVVGRQRQIPVAKHGVEVFQVIQRGVGGAQHIAAAVVPEGLLQAIVAAGGGHELPQAGGLGAGYRGGIEGAFHQRQQGDFGWHAAPLDLVHDVKQIALTTGQGALEVFRLGAVHALVAAHQLAVHFGELIAFADALPDVVAVTQQQAVALHQLLANLQRGIVIRGECPRLGSGISQ